MANEQPKAESMEEALWRKLPEAYEGSIMMSKSSFMIAATNIRICKSQQSLTEVQVSEIVKKTLAYVAENVNHIKGTLIIDRSGIRYMQDEIVKRIKEK